MMKNPVFIPCLFVCIITSVCLANTASYARDTLSVSVSPDDIPASYSENGKAIGYASSLLDIISNNSDMEFRYVFRPKGERLKPVSDVAGTDFSLMYRTGENEESYDFSLPLYQTRVMLYYKKGAQHFPGDIEKISGLIGITENSPEAVYLTRKYPELGWKVFPDRHTMVTAMKVGKIGCFVTMRICDNNLYEFPSVFLMQMPLVAAFSKEISNEKNLSALNKALLKVPSRVKDSLIDCWKMKVRLNLTREEKQWIKEHPKITVGIDPLWKPLEFLDSEGNYSGLSSEYIKRICSILGLTYDIYHDSTWAATIEGVLAGNADLISLIPRKLSRQNEFLFSDTIYTELTFVFVRSGFIDDFNISDLKGGRVGYIASTDAIPHSLLELGIDDIDGRNFATPHDAVSALVGGEIDYYFDDYSVVETTCESMGITSVKSAGELKSENNFHIGIPKNEEGYILQDLINKALATITEKEKNDFYKQWVGISKKELREKEETITKQSKQIYTYSIVLLSVAIVVLVAAVYFSRRRYREKVEYQKQLIEAKEIAEKSNRLKSAFLANMSHEIRTPLNSIVGFSGLLALDSVTPEQRKLYIENINTNNTLLLKLIDDILDLSKIETGVISLKSEPADIFYVCADAVSSQRHDVGSGPEILFDTDSEHIVILTDKERLFQILVNLLSNAKKFTDSGFIKVSYEYCREKRNICFSVQDTGKGIDPEKKQYVFERFRKLDNFSQGTGLGLAICKTIIEKMGGTIWVESEPGKGTTFFFTLPYIEPSEDDSPITEYDAGLFPNAKNRYKKTIIQSKIQEIDNPIYGDGEAPKKQKSIIVAEKDEEYSKLLDQALGEDFSIIRAHNGQQAVAFFDSEQTALLLLDADMPLMSGSEAGREIRGLSKKTPMFLLHNGNSNSNPEESKIFNEIIDKSVDIEKLKKKIRKYLD